MVFVTKKTANGVVHKYYLNGSTITAETIVNGNDVTYIEYFYDTLGAHSFSLNGTMYFYIKNLQGDVMHIATADNTIVASYTYDAWGNIESVTGTLADTVGAINPIRYRGKDLLISSAGQIALLDIMQVLMLWQDYI